MPDHKDYYAKIRAASIVDVARRLIPERITVDKGSTLNVDCPRHDSVSKTSMTIDGARNVFFCHGCTTGGDVIHFVEFVTEGSVTKDVRDRMPESHRRARDWLANFLSLPTLASQSPEEAEKVERGQIEKERLYAVLGAAAEMYHASLLESPRALAWLEEKYGITEEIVRHFGIGYSGSADMFSRLVNEHSFKTKHVLESGLFIWGNDERPHALFRERIVFPYHSSGRVVYMIGRLVPWADHVRSAPKYMKLLKNDPMRHRYVSPHLANPIWGADVLRRRDLREVVITEGITDALLTSWQGFDCISPVTVGFKKRRRARAVYGAAPCRPRRHRAGRGDLGDRVAGIGRDVPRAQRRRDRSRGRRAPARRGPGRCAQRATRVRRR